MLFLLAPRLPRFGIALFLGVWNLLVTGAIYFDGFGPSAYSLGYVVVAVLGFFFLPRKYAFPLLLLPAAAYAGVLHSAPGVQPFQRWTMTIGTAAIGGLVVAYMRERMRELVLRLTDAARTDRSPACSTGARWRSCSKSSSSARGAAAGRCRSSSATSTGSRP